MNSIFNRKHIITGAVLALASTSVITVSVSAERDTATDFKDLKPGAAGYKEIHSLVEQGIVKGYEDGTFKPFNSIPREHVARLLASAWNLKAPANYEEVLTIYKDVNKDSEYAKEIAALTAAGILKGDANGYFHPTKTINREQMATILVKAFDLSSNGSPVNLTDIDKVDASHRANVKILSQHGIAVGKISKNGHRYFDGKDKLNRVQFATLLDKTMKESAKSTVTMKKAVRKATAVGNGEAKAAQGKIKFSDFNSRAQEASEVIVDNRIFTFKPDAMSTDTKFYKSAEDLVAKVNKAVPGVEATNADELIIVTAKKIGSAGNEITLNEETMLGGDDVTAATGTFGFSDYKNPSITPSVVKIGNQIFTYDANAEEKNLTTYKDAGDLVAKINNADSSVTARNDNGIITVMAKEPGEAGNTIIFNDTTLKGGKDANQAAEPRDGEIQLTFSEAMKFTDSAKNVSIGFVNDEQATVAKKDVSFTDGQKKVLIKINSEDADATLNTATAITHIDGLQSAGGKAVRVGRVQIEEAVNDK